MSLSRRGFLGASGVAVAALPIAQAHAATPVFRHGVASGDPLPEAVVIWTRITPEENAMPGSGGGAPTAVRWRVALDPEMRQAGQTVLDGEIVALDSSDRPSFGRLQQRLGLTAEADVSAAREKVEAHLMAFDLLQRGGDSLLRTPYRERRDALAKRLPKRRALSEGTPETPDPEEDQAPDEGSTA